MVARPQSFLGAVRQTLASVPGLRRLKRAVKHAIASPQERVLAEAYEIGMTQMHTEIQALFKLVQQLKPACVLEVGTANGGTFYIWTRLALDDAALVSVDLPPTWAIDGPAEMRKLEVFRSFARGRQKLHFLRKDSHSVETRKEVTGLLAGSRVDFLFIDGDHSYEGVRKDFLNFAPLVRPGGLIAFHDIREHSAGLAGEVWRFWAELRAVYPTMEFIESERQDGFGIGVVTVPESGIPETVRSFA